MRILSATPHDLSIEAALAALKAGELVVYRTDTLYGVSAYAGSEKGMECLRELKAAAEGRPFLCLADSAGRALGASAPIPSEYHDLIPELWPGPVTLVLEASDTTPESLIAPDGSWAVRVPDSPWCRALARGLGGFVPSSSANRPGSPPCRSAAEALATLSDSVALVIDGGDVPEDAPASALVDARGWPPMLLRGSHPRLEPFA